MLLDMQRCVYKLPTEKAERLLGYRPVVTFADAMMRTALLAALQD